MNFKLLMKQSRLLSIFLMLLLLGCANSLKTPKALMTHYEEKGRRTIGSPFSGTVLIAKNGKILFNKAYGLSNRELNIPNTVDTKFPVGSITKQFTAMLIMQYVEKGDLNLNDTISKHLPYLKSDWSKKITIHQLLSHTSGLPHYEGLFEIVKSNEFVKTKYSPKELALLIDKVDLTHTINSKFHYSSLGYMLLGTLLEEVTGMAYAELLSQNIAKPLGLKNTGFASNEFIERETAKGYSFVEDESYKMLFKKFGGDFKTVPFRDQSNTFSTGGIHSTVKDLLIWSEAVKDNRILSKKYTKIMLTPNKMGYCYGWFRNWDELIERNKNAKMYTHSGVLFGHNASISFFDDGTTIIFLANTTNLKVQELTHQLYLSVHKLKDTLRIKGYPDRSSLEIFEREGGVSALNNYFRELSERCGYEVLPSDTSIGQIMYLYYKNGNQKKGDSLKQAYFKNYEPSENAINRLGYRFLEGNCETALVFFKENTLRHSMSANAWDSYGEGLLKCKKTDQAIISFTKAVAIAKTNNDKNLKSYERNLLLAKEENKK